MRTEKLVVIGVTVVVLAVVVGLVISAALKGSRTSTTSAAATAIPQALASRILSGEASAPSGFTDSLDSVGWAAYKSASRRITFPVLNKDAGSLVGKHFRIKGQVFQILDAGAGSYQQGFPDGIQPRTSMLVSMTNQGYGIWSDEIEVVDMGALPKIYEKNLVTVYGVCDGQYSYTSVAGYKMTVPLVVARYVTKP